ncbi:CsbD family protein [Mycolicibacterium chubuense]|uniref:CsbD-like protein n=1 Tax=Mycolicibacterium chubuense TaxID=1800 RepID=A0A0J6WL80_MYCCU|nr:CsbD family protein [Mycolicibacterium chubuense]KMO84085.1 CsbD-like protein [Mycolicibacterium chubuense]ORA51956.1 CsbD family protein [Mycolicibacterium chubuense]SPX99891.1 CsbD family protein [Mycolicibacterium chubuense]
MTEHEKADQARKGLIDSVKGKAKEFVGAVTNNDSLTAEGQLEQTQARERKHANTVEAVADAEAEQARTEAADALRQGAQERRAVNAEAAAAEKAVHDQKTAQKREAERAAATQAAEEKVHADLDAQHAARQAKADEQAQISAAAREVADAADEQATAEHITSNAHEEADRIRARAAHLTHEADLP